MRTNQQALSVAQADGSIYAKAGDAERPWNVAIRAVAGDELEIAVYDVIGETFWGEGFTAKDFLVKLRAAPAAKKISLRINSVGGVVDDAKAMVNLLRERATAGVEIVATVDGLAASSASFLLTAADRVEMPANAMQMVHGVRTIARGTAEDFEVVAARMRVINEQLAEAYAAASSRRGKKKSKDDYLALFAVGDTYLTADEAIEYGLADSKIETLKVAACLADINGLEGAPQALRSAPYVVLASTGEPALTPPQQTPPGPGARLQIPDTGKENNMKTIALAAFAAVLGMTVEQIEAAEDSVVLDAAKKLKAKADAEPVSSVTVSGVRLVGVATEVEATAKIQDFQRGVMQVLGATGKATIAEAMPVVLSWKAGSEQAAELTKTVATLTEQTRVAKRDAAIVASNIPPARHEWARTAFMTAEAVETFAAGLPAGFFTAINEPKDKETSTALTAEERSVCKTLGMSEEQFLKEKNLQRKVG
jgi:ATP-dependent Clp protease protease subunit